MDDKTERVRRDLAAFAPLELQAAVQRGEQVWTTDGLSQDFTVLGFLAPFVVVRRRSDGVRGTLMFTNQPRYYFGWQKE